MRNPADGSVECSRSTACVLGYGHRGPCVVDALDLIADDYDNYGPGDYRSMFYEPDAYEPEDHSDDCCPCGDPDCNRIFGHETED